MSTIALYAGYTMVVIGIVFAILAVLGFRHARRAATRDTTRVVNTNAKADDLTTTSV